MDPPDSEQESQPITPQLPDPNVLIVAGAVRDSFLDFSSVFVNKVSEMFTQQNTQQMEKFEKMFDRLDRVNPGYPGTVPSRKRPAPHSCYQEGGRGDITAPPSNTRYRVDETVSTRRRSPSPVSEVSRGRSDGEDASAPSPHRRDLDARDDDDVSIHADSQIDGEAPTREVLKGNTPPPKDPPTSGFAKWTAEYSSADSTAPPIHPDLAEALHTFLYKELPDDKLKEHIATELRPENVNLDVKKTNEFIFSCRHDSMSAIRSKDIKLQSAQLSLVKASYALLRVADSLTRHQHDQIPLDVPACIDNCSTALVLATNSLQKTDQLRREAFKPVLSANLKGITKKPEEPHDKLFGTDVSLEKRVKEFNEKEKMIDTVTQQSARPHASGSRPRPPSYQERHPSTSSVSRADSFPNKSLRQFSSKSKNVNRFSNPTPGGKQQPRRGRRNYYPRK